jgi:integrase
MPLEPYRRGATWWARGRVEYAGRPVTGYYRRSTGASEEAGAIRWCQAEEERRIRAHLLGDEQALTFADAVMLYPASPKEAGYLDPLLDHLGTALLRDITPRQVRDLGPLLYPAAAADTWVRQVVTPVRAVINNAHDLGKGPPIRIKGFDREERLAQDKRRGKRSRVRKQPGSWEWLLKFRAHADRRVAALALTMFVTGARISQAIAMHPKRHADLQAGRICIPGAKGHDDRWLDIPVELVVELANLPPLYPRGAERKRANLRLFGYADRSSPRKAWAAACKAAQIPNIPFHAAGRHGFGQEMNVRRPIDAKAAGEFGGWADTALMQRTYTHPENAAGKVHESFYAGLRAAEEATGLTLHRNAA